MMTAIYGGSFNPFGNHHRDTVRWLLTEGGFDKVVVVPAAAHALKEELPDFMHRYNMATLGVEHLLQNELPPSANVCVSQVEMDMLRRQAPPVRTYHLLQELRRLDGGYADMRFAVGPDIPEELDKWAHVEDIEREFGFVEVPDQAMRSTQIREMIAEGSSRWRDLVPTPVRDYIERHELYQKHEEQARHGESMSIQLFSSDDDVIVEVKEHLDSELCELTKTFDGLANALRGIADLCNSSAEELETQ